MKQITLCIVGLLCSFLVQAQGYQLPNNNFNTWSGGIPSSWNSFSAGKCDLSGLAWFGCGTATKNHHSQEAGRSGQSGDFAIRLYSTKVAGVIANGTLTTGRIRIGSTTATDAGNYNFSERGTDSNHAPFTASPDSLSVWVKMTAASGNTRARISTYIHGNTDFKDPNDASTKSNYSGRAAATVAPTATWTQVKQPFIYDGTSSRNYMLVTLSTNETPGAGSENDALFIDDFELIYSNWLSTLRVDGTQIDGFDKGKLNYTVSLASESTPTPVVTAIAEVSDATVEVVKSTVSDISDIYTVTVTAEDGGKKIYTVTFVRPAVRAISIASGGNGTVQYISGVSADGMYPTGTSVTVKATPELGYGFVNWTKDGVEVSTDATYTFVHAGTNNLVANFVEKQHLADMMTQFSAPSQAARQKQWVQRYVTNAKATVAGADQVLISGVTTNPTPAYNGASTAYMPGALVDKTATKIQIPAGTASFTFYAEGVKSGSNGDGLEWTNQWAFVDWNRTRDYVALAASATTVGQDLRMRDGFTRTITIPAGTTTGVYRMYIVYNEQPGTELSKFFTDLDAGRPKIKNGIAYAFDIEIFSQKTITVASNNDAWGTVSGGGTYNAGSTATLVASPQTGYSFVNWTDASGTELSKTATYVYSVTGDATITGNFKAIEHPKTVIGTSSDALQGSVALSPVSVDNTYSKDAEVVFTATAAANYRFVNWTNAAEEYSTENPFTYTGQDDLTLAGNFAAIMWDITLASGGNGTVAYTSGATENGSYQQGTSITVTATPAEGYAFVNWTNGVGGDPLSTAAAYTFALSAKVDLVANFAEKTYCTPTYPGGKGNGTTASYVGQIVTLLTTGASTEMNWTNPQTANYNGALTSIASGLKTKAGQTVSLTLSSKNTTWGFIRIFVDMNNDKEFATEECIHRDADRNQPTPLTKTFTIASGAKPGMARIRVFFAGGVDQSYAACGTMAEGGYYDFEFEVLEPNVDPTIESFNVPDAVTQNVPFSITGKAVDSDGTIALVDLYRNNIKVETVTTGEFSFTVSEPDVVSSVSFYVIATDNKGATVQSVTRTISTITNLEQSVDNRAIYAAEGNIIVKGATGMIQVTTSMGATFAVAAEETTVISGLASGQLVLITANGVTTKVML